MKSSTKVDKEKEKQEKERLKAEKEREKEAEKERKKLEKEGRGKSVSKMNVSPNSSPIPAIVPREAPKDTLPTLNSHPTISSHNSSPNTSPARSVDDIKPTLLAGSDATTPRAATPTAVNTHVTATTSSSTSDDPNVKLLKSKLSALPDETKMLVDYLLALFSRAAPPSSSVHGHQLPNFVDQADIMVNKLVEASEILFNKDHSAMLKKHIKELVESPNRRGDKWRTWVTLLNSDVNFTPLLMSSNALDASVRSSVMGPIDEEEKDVLSYILKQTVIPEIEYEQLLTVLKAFSHSHEVSQENVDGSKTVSDLIAEFFECFKKNQDAQYKADHQKYLDGEAHKHKDEPLKKGEVDPAVGTNMSFQLLHRASIVTHAKTGNDASLPLERFFVAEIAKEEKKGVRLQEVSTTAKADRAKKVGELESQIQDEDTKLQHVKAEIKDLEAQLLKKRGEEKALQENHAQKLEQLERLQDEENQKERDISTKVHANRTLLENHKKSLESLKKFDSDVQHLLEAQIKDAITNSQEMISELEKEVQFLEEKMASYERSITLFSSDEPEVLDGLKKLFARSSAVYAESKMSAMRLKTVVELLESVLSNHQDSKESHVVNEIKAALDKILHRQSTLNEKYKLQS